MVCKAGLSTVRKLWLTRHGQSEYNKAERLGGDSSISESGEKYAELLPAALLSRLPTNEPVSLSVWTSTLKRTIQTARHLPFPKLQWKALDEIDAGVCDGMTYGEIQKEMPDEFAARKQDKLKYRYPAGESYLDVIQRLEPVITEMERQRECIMIVSHQAVLRVIYGYFMGVPLEKIPSVEIPLHTLIELTPMPDGTMHETRFPVNIDVGEEQFCLHPSLSPSTNDFAGGACYTCQGESTGTAPDGVVVNVGKPYSSLAAATAAVKAVTEGATACAAVAAATTQAKCRPQEGSVGGSVSAGAAEADVAVL